MGEGLLTKCSEEPPAPGAPSILLRGAFRAGEQGASWEQLFSQEPSAPSSRPQIWNDFTCGITQGQGISYWRTGFDGPYSGTAFLLLEDKITAPI